MYWGAGDELGQALPLLPLLDALRISAAAPDPRRAAIAGMLRGEATAAKSADLAVAAAEQLLALVEELCHAGPAVLVVDELQWADRDDGGGVEPPGAVGAAAAAAPDRRACARSRAATTCGCCAGSSGPPNGCGWAGCPTRRCSSWWRRWPAASRATELAQLADGAAGNPLYLTELLDALTRGACLDVDEAGIAELTGGPAPDSLPEAIADRLGFLSEAARTVLRAAALLGVGFSVADLVTVTSSPLAGLLPALDEARAAGVLAEAGDDLAFRHPLIRKALYDELPASVRVAWHRTAAEALAEAGAPVERVARQLLPTLSTKDSPERVPSWVVHWLLDAAAPLTGQAPAVAVALLRRAVRDAPSGDAAKGVLAGRLADALYRVGDFAEAERVACRALPRATDPDLLVDLHTTATQCRAMTGRVRRVARRAGGGGGHAGPARPAPRPAAGAHRAHAPGPRRGRHRRPRRHGGAGRSRRRPLGHRVGAARAEPRRDDAGRVDRGAAAVRPRDGHRTGRSRAARPRAAAAHQPGRHAGRARPLPGGAHRRRAGPANWPTARAASCG